MPYTLGFVSDERRRRRLSLAEVEVGAHAARFALLGRSGWFRASEAAAHLGIERGSVRQHARVLVGCGLLREREVPGAPLKTFEWKVNARGAEVHRRIASLTRRPLRVPEEDVAVPAALVALGGAREEASEASIGQLLRAAGAKVEGVPGYWIE